MWLYFKRLRHSLLTNSRIGRYLLYALGELILVVLGILIALQINNWNEGRIERREAIKTYENIRRQIREDQGELSDARDLNSYLTASYERGIRMIVYQDYSRVDSLARITMGLSQFSDFNRSGNIYETLVNNGDLRLLKNDSITNALQRLENTYIRINSLEEMHWELIMAELAPELKGVINYITGKVDKPEKLFTLELQNIYYEIIGLSKMKEKVYGKALDEIEALVRAIDRELEDPTQGRTK